jgi:hypothetical protein
MLVLLAGVVLGWLAWGEGRAPALAALLTTLVVNAQSATVRVVGIKPTETKATSARQTAATAERLVRRAINLSNARNGPPRRLHRLQLTTLTVASIRTLTGSMT